jgi:hypothetical protein
MGRNSSMTTISWAARPNNWISVDEATLELEPRNRAALHCPCGRDRYPKGRDAVAARVAALAATRARPLGTARTSPHPRALHGTEPSPEATNHRGHPDAKLVPTRGRQRRGNARHRHVPSLHARISADRRSFLSTRTRSDNRQGGTLRIAASKEVGVPRIQLDTCGWGGCPHRFFSQRSSAFDFFSQGGRLTVSGLCEIGGGESGRGERCSECRSNWAAPHLRTTREIFVLSRCARWN